jgi:hypothetical protein
LEQLKQHQNSRKCSEKRGVEPVLYKCYRCNKEYTRKANLRLHEEKHGEERHSLGILNAVPGNQYLHYYEEDKHQYLVLVVQWVGLGEEFWESLGFVPGCFEVSENRIRGWAPGYEDGGKLVAEREFPVRYFDNQQYVWFQSMSR